jgi:hypothetical protein
VLLGLGVVAALALGGLVLIVGGLGIGMSWDNGPVRLTGAESDPAVHKDWEMVASALGTHGAAAERACKSPPYLALEATVQPDGRVSHVELLNYAFEPTRQCIQDELAKAALPRNTGAPVRVAVTLQE